MLGVTVIHPTHIDILLPKLLAPFYAKRFRQVPTATAYLRLAGGLARYRDVGSGQRTFLLIPDPPVVIEHYQQLEAMLSPFARFIVLEPPGLGRSIPDWSLRFSIQSIGEMVAAFIRQLDLRNVTLVGTCLGGYAIQTAANTEPDRVTGVVFAQTPCWADGQTWLQQRDQKQLLRTRWLGQIAFQLLKSARIGAWFDFALADPSKSEAMTQIAKQAVKQGGCFCLPSLFQDYLTLDQSLPSAIAQPALAVCGTADRSHSSTQWQQAKQLGRSVAVLQWSTVGHFPDLEAPESFVDALFSGAQL